MPRPKKTPQVPGEIVDDQDPQDVGSPGDDGSALPDQSEVDPTTITKAVKTRQGWVCPLPKLKTEG